MTFPDTPPTDLDELVPKPVAGRWAGVDWSWTEHAVCVVADDGARLTRPLRL